MFAKCKVHRECLMSGNYQEIGNKAFIYSSLNSDKLPWGTM